MVAVKSSNAVYPVLPDDLELLFGAGDVAG